MLQSSQRGDAKTEQVGPSLDRISWDDLRLFVVTARHRSLRKAALALRIASSTLVRRIEGLELDLGTRLFARVPEGISLTRDGMQVLAAAEKMERASFSLRGYLDRDLSTRGLIRCAITEGIGTFWLMGRLAEFHRANPYSIVDLNCTMEVADVMRYESDLAVQLVRPTTPDLIVVKLGRLHAYPFASPRYIETYGAPTSVDELIHHKIIHQASPQLGNEALQELLGASVNLEGLLSLRTNASTAHYYAVELGLGLGFLPTYAVPLGANVVPLDIGRRSEMDIWLAYHPDVREVPRIALFIDWVKSQFDPRRYPWFRDEFIHPKNLRSWKPKAEDSVNFERVDESIVVFPPVPQEVA
jgi:DNA-binding transcriptional LysR family regulator